MRRKDREVTDYKKILAIINKCDCFRLGLIDEDGAYIVPLNFGYEEKDGINYLYFHCAKEGKKLEIIKRNQFVTFEMDTKHQLVESTNACNYTYLYQSIMGKGMAFIIDDNGEKLKALKVIMAHYSNARNWTFDQKNLEQIMVVRIQITGWSCKEH